MSNIVTFHASGTNLRSKQYKNNYYYNSESGVARQGFYKGWNDGPLVGIIGFNNLSSIKWANKAIQKITITLTHGEAGIFDNVTPKPFVFWGTKYNIGNWKDIFGYQLIGKESTADNNENNLLGTVEVPCEKNKPVNFIFSNLENPTLFQKIVSFLKQNNNDTFCLYDKSTEMYGSKDFTLSYLAITSASITIIYEEGTVRYGINDEWKQCLVYYGNNGQWQQVIPYYGKDNKWNLLGG